MSLALAGRFFTTSATWEAPPIEHMPELPGAELLGEWSRRHTAVAAVELLQSCLTLCDRMDHIACQAPLSMGFSSQDCWSCRPTAGAQTASALQQEKELPPVQSQATTLLSTLCSSTGIFHSRTPLGRSNQFTF